MPIPVTEEQRQRIQAIADSGKTMNHHCGTRSNEAVIIDRTPHLTAYCPGCRDASSLDRSSYSRHHN